MKKIIRRILSPGIPNLTNSSVGKKVKYIGLDKMFKAHPGGSLRTDIKVSFLPPIGWVDTIAYVKRNGDFRIKNWFQGRDHRDGFEIIFMKEEFVDKRFWLW